MPKASSETSEAPKRAPRKRAVRRVVTKSETPVRRTRSSAVSAREVVETAPVRRAPTRTIEVASTKNRTKLYTVLALIVFIGGAATWIGVSDAGQIDVTARINAENERTATSPTNSEQENNENENESIVVPVQNTPPVVPVTGLSGRGVGTENVVQPVPEPAPEQATTTSETTTEPQAEGEVLGEADTNKETTIEPAAETIE